MKNSVIVMIAAGFVFQFTACAPKPTIPTYAGTGGHKAGTTHHKKLNSVPCPCNKKKKGRK